MRRNQPSRSKRKPEHLDPSAAARPTDAALSVQPHSEEHSKAVLPEGNTPLISLQEFPFGLVLRVCLAAVIAVFCGLIMMQIAARWRTDPWPTIADVGLLPVLGATGAGLLGAAGLAAWFACRMAYANRSVLARGSLLFALLCAGLFVGLRSYEYRELRAVGIWQRSLAGPIHQNADLYYAQAVRVRLAELFRELDTRRVERPSEFSDEDARRLELVDKLLKDMVAWTESEVGHWLDDLQQRRDLLAMVAYQVHPLARNQARVESSLQKQRQELARQRQWFRLLRDYCQAKTELLDQKRKVPAEESVATKSSNAVDAASAVEASAVEPDKVPVAKLSSVADSQEMIQLDRQWKAKFAGLGLSDWSYARSVLADSGNLSMAGERLNQVVAHLEAIDSRTAFLSETEESILGSPTKGGLNRMYHWIRLPICLPGGNAWASGFFALTSIHLLLLGAAALLSLGALFVRLDPVRLAPWRYARSWWLVFSATGIATYLLFYLY